MFDQVMFFSKQFLVVRLFWILMLFNISILLGEEALAQSQTA